MKSSTEFWCHPLVTQKLREEAWWQPSARSLLWRLYDQFACPVFEDASMPPDAWEFREDGKVVREGNSGC